MKSLLTGGRGFIRSHIVGVLLSRTDEVAAQKKKPVVKFSTSEVYGKPIETQFSETGDLTLGSTFKRRRESLMTLSLAQDLSLSQQCFFDE